MIFCRSHSGLKKQQGIATLVTVLVLLIATTIAAFTMTSSIVNEKQIVSDERRALSAFEAAQSGFAKGMVEFRNTADLPTYGNRVSGAVGSGLEEWEYWGDSSGNDVILVARGFSDDKSVQRTVRTQITFTTLDLPKVPIVTGGGATLSGNFTIKNKGGNFSIWSGGEVDIDVPGGGAWSSYVPHPSVINTYIESSNKNVRGSDLLENDPALSSLSATEFQRAFLGETAVNFCGGDQAFLDEDGSSTWGEYETFQDAIENSGSIICLRNTKESGAFDPYNPDGDKHGVKIPSSTDLGSGEKIIIIDDNWDGANPPAITGMVFVTGQINKFTGEGGSLENPKFKGSLIAYGIVDMGVGGINIEFDSSYTDNLGDSKTAASLPGNWRDW